MYALVSAEVIAGRGDAWSTDAYRQPKLHLGLGWLRSSLLPTLGLAGGPPIGELAAGFTRTPFRPVSWPTAWLGVHDGYGS